MVPDTLAIRGTTASLAIVAALLSGACGGKTDRDTAGSGATPPTGLGGEAGDGSAGSSGGAAASSSGGANTGGGSDIGGGGTSGMVNAGGSPNTGGDGGAAAASGGGLGTSGQAGAAGAAGMIGSGGDAGGGEPYRLIIITIDRGPGDGFCIQPGQIVNGAIDFDSLGHHFPMGYVFVGWVDDPAECVPQSADPACRVTERFLGEDYLTEVEMAEMYRLVDAMPEDRCQADPQMECDPCLITTLEIYDRDRAIYSDHCCGTQLSPGYDEAFEALVQFIERFAPEPG